MRPLRVPAARPLVPAVVIAVALAVPATVRSQTAPSAYGPGIEEPPRVGTDTVTVVPGLEYRAGGFKRFLFGGNYRELWTTPVRAPVLDLDRFAGGLTFKELGGGQQTKSFDFENAAGQEWVFRSVNKDPSLALPEELRGTAVAGVVKDQISSSFPAGALLVPPIAEALGVLVPRPQLAVMPDDPRLGEHRKMAAGLLGMIEEKPDDGPEGAPGFAGFTDIVGSEDLIPKLNASPEDRVDARAFLTARMLDLLINDWDRHGGQWEWGERDEKGWDRWIPIARDRDQAFFSLEGTLGGLARMAMPKFVRFGERPSVRGLTFNSRWLDQRLLAGLDRAAWDSVARSVVSRVTDGVLDSAVGRLPEGFASRIGPELRRTLAARRAQLHPAAMSWYAELARVVDVHGTDTVDVATVERHADGAVTVSLAEAEGGEPWFRRRFRPDETREVRLYLHGGDDRALARGAAERRSVLVRIIGGNGDNRLADSSTVRGRRRPTKLYDAGPTSGVRYPADAKADTLLDRRPLLPGGFVPVGDSAVALRPDNGGATAPGLTLGYASDLGLVTGAGVRLTSNGFRRFPFARRIALDFAHATAPDDSRASLTWDSRGESSRLLWLVQAEASGLELLRWFGPGNESPRPPEPDTRRIEHSLYRLFVGAGLGFGERGRLVIGPEVRYDAADTTRADFLAATTPYGSGGFGQAGLRAALTIDPGPAGRRSGIGGRLAAGASWYPELWDAEASWGEAHGEGAATLAVPLPLSPSLTLRAGGRGTWGEQPFFGLAFLGGHRDLLGYDEQRFAGDAAAWGEVRLGLGFGRVNLLLPLEVGVFGLTSAGRVWVDGGAASDDWHTGIGGGLSLGLPGMPGALDVTVVDGDERTAVYVGGGLPF